MTWKEKKELENKKVVYSGRKVKFGGEEKEEK